MSKYSLPFQTVHPKSYFFLHRQRFYCHLVARCGKDSKSGIPTNVMIWNEEQTLEFFQVGYSDPFKKFLKCDIFPCDLPKNKTQTMMKYVIIFIDVFFCLQLLSSRWKNQGGDRFSNKSNLWCH